MGGTRSSAPPDQGRCGNPSGESAPHRVHALALGYGPGEFGIRWSWPD
ncbi:hypothetical protein [Crossiella cryophila]|uniref:Uncharacterized protein n=1 Tax=Crossiella cryophila TaxID=43355 RepID=A0A7W7FVF3_9PSEU|nr:hypothetical protein [Crossiella cryophila]MBB4679237.1 hypothetical protein [Crossiella cryophila]